jgi:hypothetical protein
MFFAPEILSADDCPQDVRCMTPGCSVARTIAFIALASFDLWSSLVSLYGDFQREHWHRPKCTAIV